MCSTPRVVLGSAAWFTAARPGSTAIVLSSMSTRRLRSRRPVIYTATKLAGETYCYAYRNLYAIDYTILRFGIPYGPRARDGAVIPVFVRNALQREPLTIAGDGRQFRKFVYVEDLAEGIVLGLRPRAANRVQHLDGADPATILQIAEAVRSAVGDVQIVHKAARPGDFSGKDVSSKRACRELGWEAGYPIR